MLYKQFCSVLDHHLYKYKSLTVAVAVSGGVDSLCLALLTRQWCLENKLKMVALIVNHNLRENSLQEANYVFNLLNKLSINTVILNRNTNNLSSKLQENARIDRYNLLQNYCKQHHIPYLFIGHHKNDVMETVLMRQQKGHTLIGLAGISLLAVKPECTIVRPLLNFNKLQLTEYVTTNFGKKWVEDASNTNDKFNRVKVRKQLLNYNKLQVAELNLLTLENIVKRQKLENEFVNFIIKEVNINAYGVIYFNQQYYASLPKDFKRYFLYKLLQYNKLSNIFIKLAKIDSATQAISNSFNTFTLANNIILTKKIAGITYIMLKPESKINNLVNNGINRDFVFNIFTQPRKHLNTVSVTEAVDANKSNLLAIKNYYKLFFLNYLEVANVPVKVLDKHADLQEIYFIYKTKYSIMGSFFYA